MLHLGGTFESVVDVDLLREEDGGSEIATKS